MIRSTDKRTNAEKIEGFKALIIAQRDTGSVEKIGSLVLSYLATKAKEDGTEGPKGWNEVGFEVYYDQRNSLGF